MLDIRGEIRKATPRAGIDLSAEQIERLKTVGAIALAITAVAGVLAVSAVAPNIFVALDKIFGKKQYGSRKDTLDKRQAQLAKSFYYMRRQGYINIEKKGGFLIVHPTEKGLKRVAELNFDNLLISRPKSWSGTWWVIMADIPSKFRIAADMFQMKLKQMGCYPLQRSVWIHPFDPRGEVEAVAAYYRVSPFVTLMEVKRLEESDKEMLEKFFQEKRLI
ncbi:MAG: hypothetical protein A2846_02600 [Candidatus Doudnabacteria bacterium RIFCSPHIGHO2_01_FULL_49_9]|uniref:Transcriptional repressor PaaX-like central Cas2-like domain-containing protein n=1 Tax=Candidatus Doudnabacteria bacterium RIFCSPHIGHO2_01_FULL_49_9 TaxID=1817827 RepID=A0A1F5P485_9BACT|nr:MAG: hypothetical protein A2846_02600 [Candidatus Doudnabacteria bacterium RIFCSPHIGHO2_01_FULL_49_9]